MIYNIFYISVVKDIKRYGLLKTIGTTKRQIGRLVNIQALLYSAVGIPVGLCLGYLLAQIMLPWVLSVTAMSDGGSAMTANPYIFALAAVLCLLTVFISCRTPAKIAGKISPVEATRYTGAANSPKRTTKSGATGADIRRMALSNLFRTKKKTVLSIASVCLGLILFNMVFTFTGSFDVDKYLKGYINGDFLVADSSYINGFTRYAPTDTLTSEAVSRIASLDGVENVQKVYYDTLTTTASEQDIFTQVYGIDSGLFTLLDEGTIDGEFDAEKFRSGKYAVLCVDTTGNLQVGDIVSLDFEGESRQYEIMSRVG
jgi:putative ABC transport system permease protein